MEEGNQEVVEEWHPSEGRIELRNAWMRYREDLSAVLKGVSFTIEPGHKGNASAPYHRVALCILMAHGHPSYVTHSGCGWTYGSWQVFSD